MSNRTLYEDAINDPNAEKRWVLPVKPCKHGNVFPHHIPEGFEEWCDGKPEADE